MRKLKNSKRDENDILKFDFEIERARDAVPRNGLERLTCSIAIARPRVVTQPWPVADIAAALADVGYDPKRQGK